MRCIIKYDYPPVHSLYCKLPVFECSLEFQGNRIFEISDKQMEKGYYLELKLTFDECFKLTDEGMKIIFREDQIYTINEACFYLIDHPEYKEIIVYL